MNFNKFIFLLFTITFFFILLVPAIKKCNAEYLIYKIENGQAIPLTDRTEHLHVYQSLVNLQFPMNCASPLQRTTTDPKNEQEFLEESLRKNVNDNLRLLWLPNTLYERFFINMYFLMQIKYPDIRTIASELSHFYFDALEQYKDIFEEYDLLIKQIEKKTDSKIPVAKSEILASLFNTNDITFIFTGFPPNFDPICKHSRDEYKVASTQLNLHPHFVSLHFFTNYELFNYLQNWKYDIKPVEKMIPKAIVFPILLNLISEFSKIEFPKLGLEIKSKDLREIRHINSLLDKMPEDKLFLEYKIPEKDIKLLDYFSDIIDKEYDAYTKNCFLLYRGTDGIKPTFQLDSPIKQNDLRQNDPLYLSYGSGLYSAILADPEASPWCYFDECRFFYVLFINKNDYFINEQGNTNEHNTNLNLVFIPPFTTIVSMFGFGKYCHPRGKSFRKQDPFDFLAPPIFLDLISLPCSPEICEKLYSEFLTKNAKLILKSD